MTKTSHDSETPAKDQQVITACAFIHHSFNGIEKVFLPKRADIKKFLPGVYEMPGGHVDFGENIIIGLKREVQEELEVNINIGDAFAVFDYTNEIKGSHSVEIIYFATLTDKPEAIKLHADDHSDGNWFSEDELDGIITPTKDMDDPEFIAIKKAFALLKGQQLDFAAK